MFYGHLDYFQIPPLGGRLNTKMGDHGHTRVVCHCLSIGEVPLHRVTSPLFKTYFYQFGFSVLLAKTSLDIMDCSFIKAYKT